MSFQLGFLLLCFIWGVLRIVFWTTISAIRSAILSNVLLWYAYHSSFSSILHPCPLHFLNSPCIVPFTLFTWATFTLTSSLCSALTLPYFLVQSSNFLSLYIISSSNISYTGSHWTSSLLLSRCLSSSMHISYTKVPGINIQRNGLQLHT